MIHLQQLKIHPLIKWVSCNLSQNVLRPSCSTTFGTDIPSSYFVQFPRFMQAFAAERNKAFHAGSTLKTDGVGKISNIDKKGAQAALLDYLHSTRSLQFTDAEYISKNSPNFLQKLLKKVEKEIDKGKSLVRFLRYHPINEFEPFFESMGLEPSEFLPLLPRDLMFLSDDYCLFDNYQVLCHYGVARNRIGKIYKEAPQVFQYSEGVLQSRLRAYGQVGLSQSAVAKLVSSCPYLLVGEVNKEFVVVLERLKDLGFDDTWIEGHLLERKSYKWRQIYEFLCMLRDFGFEQEDISELISQHHEIIFEDSGNRAFSLTGFLLKFGCSRNDISLVFSQIPQLQVANFVYNIRNGFQFLTEIEMNAKDIGRIIRSHPVLMGSSLLKKTNTILANLNSGKRRVSEIVRENPKVLEDWVLGAKIRRLPDAEVQKSLKEKSKFLLRLGFVENTREMTRALNVFRGKGLELQERFDFLVETGLDVEDVSKMVKVAPQILNQSIEVLQMKIDYLMNNLGYPVSSLVAFPSFLSYTILRVKIRYAMYLWLKDNGACKSVNALSSIIACSDRVFCNTYVNRHPRGPDVWQILKKKIYGE